jgi:hypothetical protein
MANAVVEQNEVFLNGVYYPITRSVRSTLASIYPAKVVIGDTSKDSQLRSSIIAWSDWRGGIGLNRMEGAGEVNRAWYSTCQLRYKNHLVLPGLATVTANVTHSLTGVTIGAINTYGNEIYVAWNGAVTEDAKIYKYNNTSDSWGSELDTTADQVTDSVVFTDGSLNSSLVFAHFDAGGSNYTYYNGSTWTTAANGVDTKFMTVWDERLWGISHEGQLWYATTIGTEVLDAKLPLPAGSITALFVARNAFGVPIIYASTKQGLFAHNADNARFEETQMAFPTHPDNGKGSTRWRDSVYIPSGNGIYKYINGSNSAVITVVGPDRDDGLPSDRRGAIRYMAGTHNELLVGLDARAAPSEISNTSFPYQWIGHHGARVLDPTTGYSTMLGYNEMGWEVKWQAADIGRGFDAIHVSDAYSKYRAWWGHNNRVYFMDMPKDIINPSEVGDFAYATSGVHQTPWFNAGQSEIDKLALNLRIEAQGLTANETVTVQYALDYNEATYYNSPGLVNASVMGAANGTYPHTFKDDDENPVGKTFRAIKFKVTLARSSATTTGLEKLNTPDMVSLTLEWRKKIPAKWGHTVDVDLSNEYKGNVPKDLRAALISAIESTTLVEFTFRDDSGGTRNYYVDVTAAQGMEFTGHDERGSTTIQVVEP